MFDEKYQKLLKELILENKYLRGINILPKNINNDYLLKLKKQIEIEKMKKELLINHQFTNRNDNNLNNNNNLDNQNNNKDNNNPFIHNDNETSLNSLNNQVSHKRQRTHFNLGKLNKENSMNRDSIGSSHNLTSEQNSVSVNTVIDNKDKEKDKDKESSYYKNNKNNNNKSENIFCEALKEMSNYNKTLKKMNNNSKKNILENKNENNVNDGTKLNKYGNKMVNNIPYNVNKSEYANIPNDKGDNRKNSKNDIKTNIKNNDSINNYVNDKLNENENSKNKKQQSIYYRASKEKEKKKIEFTK
jgi:hypothetical protein